MKFVTKEKRREEDWEWLGIPWFAEPKFGSNLKAFFSFDETLKARDVGRKAKRK